MYIFHVQRKEKKQKFVQPTTAFNTSAPPQPMHRNLLKSYNSACFAYFRINVYICSANKQ